MNEPTPQESSVISLLTAFAASLGTEANPAQPLAAVEFVSGDHVASLFPHPGREDLLCVEISLRALALGEDESDHERLLFLHRLNAAARHDHAWTNTIDDEDMLLLTAAFPWNGLDAESLADLVAEGLQRAESLDALWQSLAKETQESGGGETEEPAQPNPLEIA
jgi:hypothetical protein